ncbi:glycosyl transferase [Leptolyngbya sp. PCC 7375]|nr:glycosyl transferase [Leptolyngbya sp. PCC 7375]
MVVAVSKKDTALSKLAFVDNFESTVFDFTFSKASSDDPLKTGAVTVVIPALNEAGNLEKLFERISIAFDELSLTLPVLVVDDGSTDESPEILAQLAEKHTFLSVIRHPQRLGVAAVWQTALEHVETDWIFWGQADLESDPATDIPALLRAYRPGMTAVAGWRQQRGDGKTQASQLANRACHWTFGLKIHDMNWIKLVRRDALVGLPIELITHRFLLAVLAGLGHQVEEVKTHWHPRFSGTSKFGKKRLMTSAQDFLKVVTWFYLERPLGQASRYITMANTYVQERFLAETINA